MIGLRTLLFLQVHRLGAGVLSLGGPALLPTGDGEEQASSADKPLLFEERGGEDSSDVTSGGPGEEDSEVISEGRSIESVYSRAPPATMGALVYVKDAAIDKLGRITARPDSGPRRAPNMTYIGCPYELAEKKDRPTFRGLPLPVVVVLTQVFITVYYHYVADSLSRVYHVLRDDPGLMARAHFHVGNKHPWALDWAQLVGIPTPASTLVVGDVHADVAVWPQSNGCGIQVPEMLRGFQGVLMNRLHVQLPSSQTWSRLAERQGMTAILLVRSSRRIMSNLEAVRQQMKDYGFSVLELSETDLPSVGAQCEMFRRAHLVLGVDGGGLTNIICAQRGTHVVELETMDNHGPVRNSTYSGSYFKPICSSLGLKYDSIPTRIPHDFQGGRGHVSLTLLAAALKRVRKDKGLPPRPLLRWPPLHK